MLSRKILQTVRAQSLSFHLPSAGVVALCALFLFAQVAEKSHGHDKNLDLSADCTICLNINLDDHVLANSVHMPIFKVITTALDGLPLDAQVARIYKARVRAPPLA
jgi:hypothetical protein